MQTLHPGGAFGLPLNLRLLGVLSLVITVVHATPPLPEGERLQVLADAADIWIGAAVDKYDITNSNFPDFSTVVEREYSFLTSFNEMKMAVTEPSQGVFSYTTGQQLIDFASMIGADVHGHTLIWCLGSGMPSWISSGTWTASGLTNVMNNHIDNVAAHWAGQISAWDVVNESFAELWQLSEATDGSNQPWTNSLRGSKAAGVDRWYDAIGPSYIEKAFVRTRSAAPNSLLLYNDYGIEESNYKSGAVLKMIADFQARGIPIDGIGAQMHMWHNPNAPGLTLRSTFDAYSNLGIKVFITEFDCPSTVLVPNGSGGYNVAADSIPPTPFGLDRQARSFYTTLDMALRTPGFSGFQTWGVTNATNGEAKCPFSSSGFAPEPAYYAIQDALAVQVRDERVSNPGMESGTTSPWTSGNSTLTLSTTAPHSGANSLAVTSRAASYDGPRQNVTGMLASEGTGRYFIRGWMRTNSGFTTGKLTLSIKDSAGTWYLGISKPISSSWTEVSGWVNVVWFKQLISATLYAETPGATVDFYLDDVTMSDGNLAQNGNFSNGITGWAAYTGGSISSSTHDTNLNLAYKYGTAGCLCESRTAPSQGPGQNIKAALLASGPGIYNIQAWLKLQKPDASTTLTGTGKVTVQLTYDGSPHYIGIRKAISSDQWTRISGALDLTWTGTLTSALLYVETPESTSPIYIDEVVLRK
ncbi:MAG: endo-1,4-beta-xylanase [Opitutaceae bacterium]|jgi:GH35 family endo-1,4-beta-xylanase